MEHLLEKQSDPSSNHLLHLPCIVKVELEISQLFKGKINTKTISIYTPSQGATCGFKAFAEGESFVVYSYQTNFLAHYFTKKKGVKKAGTFWTNHCTRTSYTNQEEIAQLNKLVQSIAWKTNGPAKSVMYLWKQLQASPPKKPGSIGWPFG